MISKFSSISGLQCLEIAFITVIGGSGLDICDEGQVKDTRGVCKTAYTFSPPKEEEDVETRDAAEIPKRPRDLRKYLQSKYRF